MQLQATPNAYSCLLTSFSMASGIPIGILIEEIGHDGSETVFHTAHGVKKYRAFHPQEFVNPLLRRGMSFTHISADPVSVEGTLYYRIPTPQKLSDYIVMPGRYVLMTASHAVACDGHEVFDPAGEGRKYGLSAAFTLCAFEHLLIIHKIVKHEVLCDSCGLPPERIVPVFQGDRKVLWFQCCNRQQESDW